MSETIKLLSILNLIYIQAKLLKGTACRFNDKLLCQSYHMLSYFVCTLKMTIIFRHAKRTTVSAEDVKLCCRRMPSLLEFISGQADKLKAEREAGREGGGATAGDSAATMVGKKTKGGRKKTTITLGDE